ncbi:MAG TPA: HAD family acid phosphatase [Acidobacteriaceae bacterium]|nr:HAD family acid phosphatase [Acidobacteriaceae bacterium]
MIVRHFAFFSTACLFVVLQAAHAQTVLVPKELPNLGQLQLELKDYHDCKGTHGCYTADLNRETAAAIAELDRLIRLPHPGRKLAVVLDIDETSLSNYAEILQADFAYNHAAWDHWVDQATAPAIPGTLRFYQEAGKLGVAVFFITGRPESQRAATEKNLRSQGFTQWAGLTLRAPAEANTPTTAFKSAARQRIVAAGYRIVVNMGDQMSDLNGSPQAQVSVKLSDPFYYIP